MLGDIFLNFTTQLRAYTNFLNNYPVTLQTLERVSFAFINRYRRLRPRPNVELFMRRTKLQFEST